MLNSQQSLFNVVLLWVFLLLALNVDAQHSCQKLKSASDNILLVKSQRNTPNNEDITYLKARWNLDPAIRQISGSVQFSFTITSQSYDSLQLDLSDSLTVIRVLSRGEEMPFIRQNDRLIISLPGMAFGDTSSVQVDYSGIPSNSGFGSFITSNTPAGDPVMWTLSQPFGASDWWPCKESFSDKIDSSDFFISIPPGNKAAGNGKLISVDSSSNVAHIYHWKHRYPIATYLIAVAVTNYTEIRREVPLRDGNLELLNYCYPAQLGEWEWQQTEVIAMLQYFDSLFTPYPFMLEKYGHAQFGWGGGMEHQTMSFMADLGPWLTSHELGHQWFGDAVTCASWKDIWLNEGFATYITGLFFERFNPLAFYYWKRNVRDEITALPGGSVIVDDTTSVQRIFDGRLSYSKGAYVLHMLRNTLGKNLFYNGLRAYLEDPQLKHGFAETPDFQSIMEAESGFDLDTFFTQWIYGEGFPKIDVQWKPTVEGVYVRLTQSSSNGSPIPFNTQVPLRLIGVSDSLDTTVKFNQNEAHFLLKPGFSVLKMRVDPQADWLARYNLTFLNDHVPEKEEISVFPNPFSSSFFVRFPTGKLPLNLQIFHVDGKQIPFTVDIDKDLGIYKLQLTKGLSAGQYYLQLEYTTDVLLLPLVVIP
jgi:aminopeptidase N